MTISASVSGPAAIETEFRFQAVGQGYFPMPGKTTLNIIDNSLQQMLNLNAVIPAEKTGVRGSPTIESARFILSLRAFGVCSWTLLSLLVAARKQQFASYSLPMVHFTNGSCMG